MRETTTVGDELTDTKTAGAPSTSGTVGNTPGKKAKKEREASLWSDAVSDLRRNPIFLIGSALVLLLVVLSAVPQWFTPDSPFTAGACQLQDSLKKPSADHWFGFDVQGCDVYTRTVWAARNSIIVGIVTTALVIVVGGALGLLAGWVGGLVDSLLSRFTEIFFAIPLLLGGMLIMSGLGKGNAWTVSIVLATLGWPQIFRIMRSSVLQNKNNDYVVAARALGAGTWRITMRHILPNAIAPVIVVGAISLGVYIGAEAALSYLGIGVQPPGISWGLMVSDASVRWLQAPHVLLFPAAALSITVLAFIMVGDAVRDALDPKLR
ncbi:ABC transporter permease [Streptomyces lavendulae]|uniref:Oligopeptide transport system permease protein OppC n=1 Tax=Streptomyces lavendulae subsp. lavendulae TaxID=58340 RepID=A0A2K8PD50_STRLA|nr:ABC transporter permease [Streptomyces lavendulae]ATZ24666.1 Oligopeptide transport system permease protein OppC [Streptomyces lavendulae subsp. lavendulae]QUQ54496.1 Oligopeptide transport system permease protein OppC [Streptomyces lavendulae subsp. lavendulae]